MESHAELVTKIRKRLKDALENDVFDEKSKSAFELTLIQILNECESLRQKCLSLEVDFKIKASQAEAQAHAYSSMSSIIYATLNGLVKKSEEDIEEIAEREVEVKRSKKK